MDWGIGTAAGSCTVILTRNVMSSSAWIRPTLIIWGAEIEFCLGEEQEIYSFDEPTAVVVPAGVPHGPVTTKRIVSPKGFGCYVAALSSIPKSKWVEKINQATQPTGKYQHLVKSLKPHIAIERGEINLAGFTPEQMARLMKENKKWSDESGTGQCRPPDTDIWE